MNKMLTKWEISVANKRKEKRSAWLGIREVYMKKTRRQFSPIRLVSIQTFKNTPCCWRCVRNRDLHTPCGAISWYRLCKIVWNFSIQCVNVQFLEGNLLVVILMKKHQDLTICDGILLGHEKEWNSAICSNIGGPRDYHTKWSKSEKDKYLKNQQNSITALSSIMLSIV